MGNRGRVGAIFARGRAPVILVLLLVGGAFLLRRDVTATPAHDSPAGSALSNPQQIRSAFGRLPLSFEPNQGQSDSRVKFLARGNGYGLYLTPTEAVLALPQAKKDQNRPVVEMQFGGANQSAQLAGTNLLPGKSNYFIGNDPSRWHRNIPQFSRVQYRDLYSGIDLDFYGKQGRLEYDFEVAPGADPSQIALDFKGTKNLQVAANGDLVLFLDGGEVRFEAPRVYQKIEDRTQTVAGSFVLRSDNQVAFEVGAYDRSRALVIDPVLTFSTYLGGSGAESCTAIIAAPATFVPHCPAIAVDSATRVYIAGATTSSGSFPVPSGTSPTLNGGADVFLVRFNSTGTALDYTTYVGGSGTEYPSGVGVDSGFNVFVAGTTNSPDFPTTTSAFQSGPGSAGNHVFFSKFDSSGSVDLYSTYLSGTTGVDTTSDLALDPLGRAYILGTTSSSDFPTTAGALQTTAAATNQFFFSKVDPTASGTSSLLYSTFLGGSSPSNGVVTGGSIAVDATFNVYMAGGTSFTDMPIVNPYQGTYQGGAHDVWAAKLSAPANNTQQYTPLYETYFGGSGDDIAYGVATDGTDTFITGSTTSTNITPPSTILAFQSTNGGGTDAFVAKLGTVIGVGTAQGTVPLLYFSYLGGTATDTGLSVATDLLSGNARVTGFTDSNNFPVTSTAGSNIQAGPGGGRDAFVARILTNTVSTTTNTSTANYLGGSGTDIGTSIAIDANLNDYLAGETSSGNFPVQPVATPFQGSLSGSSDAFVTKLGPNSSGLSFTCTGTGCPVPVPANPAVSPSPVGVGNQVTFRYSIYNTGDPVAGVLFTDTLSSNSTFVSASGSPGTCPTSAQANVVVCNLGIIPTSLTVTSGTTTTTSPAAAVTLTATSIVPTVTGVMPPTPAPISNSATLTAGPGFSTASAQGTATVNDFGVSILGPNTQTVTAGAQATYQVKITPTGPIPESVSLSCGSGLPAGAACTFLNNPIPNLNNGAQSRSLEITTQFRVTTPASIFRRGPIFAFWFPVSGLAMLGAGVSRKRRLLLGLFFVAVLGTVALQAGCGSSSSTTSTTTGTPAGTYTITVNATSVAVRSTTVQLTVN
jgi:uncharacterized repeat protein (TIGR01451 family)